MPFTEPEIETIIVANYITSGLNLAGSLFTITTYILFKDARNGATALVFCLALSDFCTACATSFLWVFLDMATFPCHVQGTLLMFGLCASCLWGLMIGCYMFLALYKSVELETLDKYRFIFHMISWGYALAAGLAPLIKGKYGIMFPGHHFSWCWIRDSHSGFRMMLYFPDTIIFVVLIILYMLTRQRLKSTQGTLANEICQKMSMYLLVYVFINLFAIINRLQNFFAPDDIVFPLFLMQFLTQPLQGFLNAIAYVWNEPAFIDQYKQLFSRCACHSRARIRPLATSIQEENERLLRSIVYDDVP